MSDMLVEPPLNQFLINFDEAGSYEIKLISDVGEHDSVSNFAG